MLALLGLVVLLGVIGLLRSREPVAAPAAGLTWLDDLRAASKLSHDTGKPLHVVFTRPDVPLAPRQEETLAAPPVRQLAATHFVNLRLDSVKERGAFERLLGTAGALGSAVVDLRASETPDVIAVSLGYVDVDRYVAFLDGAQRALARVRELHEQRGGEAFLALGETYEQLGSSANAAAAYGRVLETALEGRKLEHLARLHTGSGKIAEARGELEQARKLGAADSPRWPLTEALLLSSERHVSEAIALLAPRASELPAGNERARALLLLGKLEHELKRDAAALGYLEQLRATAPGTLWAREADEQIFHINNPQPDHTH